MEPKGVAAVDRALLILNALGRKDKAVSLAELAHETGLYRSTILRLIVSLSRAECVQRLESGSYQLGPKLLQLGQVYQETFQIGDFVRPELHSLAEKTGESSSFFIRNGNCRICLYRVDSLRPVREHIRVGEALPLDKGAAGRILLALTEPSDPRYAEIQDSLVTWSKEERAAGAAAVATPVFGLNNTVVGAMTISGLATRFVPERASELTEILLEASARLSRKLGGDGTRLERALAAFQETRQQPETHSPAAESSL